MRSNIARLTAIAGFLTVTTAAFAVDVPTPAATPAPPVEEKKICRSTAETGSLVKKHRTCMTKAQWAYIDEQHGAEARKMVEDNMGRPPGN